MLRRILKLEMFGRLLLTFVVVLASILILVKTAKLRVDDNDQNDLYRDLFNCQLTFSQKPEIYKVQLNVYNLLLAPAKQKAVKSANMIDLNSTDRMTFEKINYRETWRQLNQSNLDPSLPFTFFINGFNHNGAINGSWLEGVSKMLVNRRTNRQSSNIVLLPWQVSGILTSDLVSTPIAYYRTMACYSDIMEEIALVFTNIIDFVEKTRAGGSWKAGENFNKVRAKHYAKFKFYAHSLGSHVVSSAIELVHKSRPWVKFGTMVGLDPALPCFLDENHGLSIAKLRDSVEQVEIVHSNAAFSGIYTGRGHFNIVLNGGTFQPSCHWLDFSCSHNRATSIFSYSDENCEMVAYKCNKYEQFKLGACETCDSTRNGSDAKCVLVNLVEQHSNTAELLFEKDKSYEYRLRQLADNYRDLSANYTDQITSRQTGLTSQSGKLLPKSYGYYFVHTDPNFMTSNTHCMQHYQLRLLTLADKNFQRGQEKCPFGSYLMGSSKDIWVKLVYEDMNDGEQKLQRHSVLDGPSTTRSDLNGLGLTPIVADKLYTGLVTSVGKAELFVGAIIDSIDFGQLSKCLIEQKVTDNIRFTLDIAFMSNTKSSVRHAYSSILCGQWNPHNQQPDLVLTLCKQSELTDVSDQIDKLLAQITFQHQYESWKVSLLNSLFYLYSKWNPLRQYLPRDWP